MNLNTVNLIQYIIMNIIHFLAYLALICSALYNYTAFIQQYILIVHISHIYLNMQY